MLVLSKLTNINHANGGSYDPPLFLYSALFAARGRFGGASPHGGGFGGASPPGGELLRGFPARLSLPPRYIRLGAGSFFAVFRIRARHTAKASAKISPVTLPYFILHRKIQEVC